MVATGSCWMAATDGSQKLAARQGCCDRLLRPGRFAPKNVSARVCVAPLFFIIDKG